MPRRNQENGETKDNVIELVNSGARADLIRSAARYIEDREAEIKAIREDITEYKAKHIKGDLGFKLSDWGTVYRMYKLESEDRDTLLDTIREGFKALGVGGSVDWVDAAEQERAGAYDA